MKSALVAIGLILATKFHLERNTGWAEQLRVLVPPPASLKYFTFGFDLAIGDLLWIRTIQDIDYCSATGCQRGWTFQMLDMITDLAPRFRMPYAIGAISLSLLSEDVAGASRIYSKAMARFPEDWTYPYRAGYHAMIYEKKPEKAANLFRLAAEKGAPKWLYSLATTNYLRAGRHKLAELLYRDLVREKIPPGILARIKKRIETRNSGELVDGPEK